MRTEKMKDLYQSLSFEQKIIFDEIVFKRQSAFFTGQAGTGKSYLMRAIIESLRALIPREFMAITALTGIAAINIQGQTLHSATCATSIDCPAGESVNDSEQRIYKRVHQNGTVRQRMCDLKVLIIDEVSMLTASWFDAMQLMFQKVRRSKELFGGLQVVLCGDFMQLPPINSKAFLFQSEEFAKIPHKFSLTHSFRQNDELFLKVLNLLRNGIVNELVTHVILKRQVTENQLNEQQRREVQEKWNEFKLMREQYLNQATQQKEIALSFDLACQSPETLLINVKQSMRAARKSIDFAFLAMNEKYSKPTFPVRLYSTNVRVNDFNRNSLIQHQGTMYKIGGDDSGTPEQMQYIERPEKEIFICEGAQVMVNRNVDLAQNLSNGTVAVIRRIIFQGPTEESQWENHKLIVLNAIKNYVHIELQLQSGAIVMLAPFKADHTNSAGNIVASRLQIPLQLSYAISIHKSQGLTLERAVLALDKCFENGQAYVALSRLKSLDGLQVINFDPNGVKADQSCKNFCESLQNIDYGRLFRATDSLVAEKLMVGEDEYQKLTGDRTDFVVEVPKLAPIDEAPPQPAPLKLKVKHQESLPITSKDEYQQQLFVSPTGFQNPVPSSAKTDNCVINDQQTDRKPLVLQNPARLKAQSPPAPPAKTIEIIDISDSEPPPPPRVVIKPRRLQVPEGQRAEVVSVSNGRLTAVCVSGEPVSVRSEPVVSHQSEIIRTETRQTEEPVREETYVAMDKKASQAQCAVKRVYQEKRYMEALMRMRPDLAGK